MDEITILGLTMGCGLLVVLVSGLYLVNSLFDEIEEFSESLNSWDFEKMSLEVSKRQA